MDCYEAMKMRRRLFREGKVSLTEFDPDLEQEREDRDYINDRRALEGRRSITKKDEALRSERPPNRRGATRRAAGASNHQGGVTR